ncbi:MAG: ATP-grasp domain-containing protein [Planctomycetia bacterium]
MRILIHAWCCSGGLTGPGAVAADTLHAEGRAMFTALVRDARRDPSLEVTALVDATRPLDLPPEVRIRAVPAGGELAALVAAAPCVDTVIVVAPETDGLLAARVAAVRSAGGDALAPPPAFIIAAADKQATTLALAAAGVPVPAGRRLAAGESWPPEFIRPAVGKPLDGAGGDGIVHVAATGSLPDAVSHPLRIEALVAGEPVGVSCLCGPDGIRPLAPLAQCFDAAGRFIGGVPLPDPARGARASALGARAVAALARATAAPPRGWVGVDMILGPAADGRDDRVLEVNPRFTTSFLGHAAGTGPSLVRLVLEAAAGRALSLDSQPRAFQLATDDRSTRRDG